MTQPGKRSIGRFVLTSLLALPFAIGGVAIVFWGVGSVRDEYALRGADSVVEATVTARRVRRDSDGGRTYGVRYRFRLPGSSQVYTASDSTGRRNLWMSIDSDLWRQVRQGRKISVAYLPGDPWANRPTESEGSPFGDAVAGLVLGLVVGLIALGVWILALLDLMRPLPVTAPTEIPKDADSPSQRDPSAKPYLELEDLPDGEIPAFPKSQQLPDLPPGMYALGHLWHWDGEGWRHESLVDAEPFTAIWGQDELLFAVGWGEIWHRFPENGRWQKMLSDVPRLFGVSGSAVDDVYAVGPQALFHWEGSAWTRLPLEHGGFWAVWCQRSGSAFLAGNEGQIMHLSDRGGQPEQTPVTSTLRAVHGAGEQIYAVGDNGVILRRDPGGSWTREAPAMTTEDFASVWVTQQGDIFAVTNTGAVLMRSHAQAGAWSTVLKVPYQLTQVYGVADRIYVVGLQGAIFERTELGTWQNISGQPYLTINALFGTSKDTLWIGGDQFYELT